MIPHFSFNRRYDCALDNERLREYITAIVDLKRGDLTLVEKARAAPRAAAARASGCRQLAPPVLSVRRAATGGAADQVRGQRRVLLPARLRTGARRAVPGGGRDRGGQRRGRGARAPSRVHALRESRLQGWRARRRAALRLLTGAPPRAAQVAQVSEDRHHSMRRVAVGVLAAQANYWPYVQVPARSASHVCRPRCGCSAHTRLVRPGLRSLSHPLPSWRPAPG